MPWNHYSIGKKGSNAILSPPDRKVRAETLLQGTRLVDEGHQYPGIVRLFIGQEAGEVERVADLQALEAQPDLPPDVGGVVIHRDDMDPPAAARRWRLCCERMIQMPGSWT
jgi:hypothetical protein